MSKRKIMWQKRIDFLPFLMCKLAINPIIIPDPRPLVSENGNMYNKSQKIRLKFLECILHAHIRTSSTVMDI